MRVHLITASAAFAAGLTTGLVGAGAPEVEAAPLDREKVVECVATPAQKTAVELALRDCLKPEVEAEFGNAAWAPARIKRQGVTLQWVTEEGTEELRPRSAVRVPGMWVPEVPE
jgi:hypothetical protein